MFFGANQIASECFSEMMFVLWERLSLGNSSKNHKWTFVKTPGGVARENSPKLKKWKIPKETYCTWTWNLRVHYGIKVPNNPGTCCSYVSSFSPYRFNCGDWSSLDLDTFELFLTKTTITFVALISPYFWGGQTYPF